MPVGLGPYQDNHDDLWNGPQAGDVDRVPCDGSDQDFLAEF